VRSPERSDLSAILVVCSLLVTACTTTSTIEAAAPETPQNSITQDRDRGVTADPLPAVTPTVSSLDEDASSIRKPIDGDELSELERAALQPSPLGIPSTTDRQPLWYGEPFTVREHDLANVTYAQTPLQIDLPLPNDGSHRILGFTPDGSRAWVSIPDPVGNVTCGEDDGSVLATIPLGGVEPPTLVQPADGLPANIWEVHAGPDGHVLIYASCGGHYVGPTAFARVTPDGNFTNVAPVHEELHKVLFVYEPRWIWATESGGEYSYDDTGRLVVVIPQWGMNAPGDATGGRADVYIDVETAEILDIFPSEAVATARLNYAAVVGTHENVMVDGEVLDEWTGPVWDIRTRRGFTTDGSSAVVSGEDGAIVITRQGNEPVTTTRVSTTAVTDARWSPAGDALAISDANGTRLIVGSKEIQLTAAEGPLFFSPSGSMLLVDATTKHLFVFPPTTLPDDSTEVTAFSQIDSAGLGPIRIGMSVSELRALLDIDLTLQIGGVDDGVGSCAWITSPELGPISMLGQTTGDDDATITAISVYNTGPWATPSGLRIGSTEEEIRSAVAGQFDEQPHAYIAGNYIFFQPSDPDDPFGIKFETNGHEAFAVHVGYHEWISYVEGCA